MSHVRRGHGFWPQLSMTAPDDSAVHYWNRQSAIDNASVLKQRQGQKHAVERRAAGSGDAQTT